MMLITMIILAFGGNANKKANISNAYEQLLLVRATCNIKIVYKRAKCIIQQTIVLYNEKKYLKFC